ncbi:MAG: hypothetical protein MJ147_08100 [Clostridia bacterium]|nr:hypothetical protein [Clostridia bacterium]
MTTLLTAIAYLVVIYAVLKLMWWVTKLWIKISLGVVLVGLVVSAIGFLFV